MAVRAVERRPRAEAAREGTGLPCRRLAGSAAPVADHAALCTMHLARGMEFRAVPVTTCDGRVVPLASRLEGVASAAVLCKIHETERHLLHVTCTRGRGRDRLRVSGAEPVSDFAEDLRA